MRDAGCGAPHPASRIPQGAGCGLRVAESNEIALLGFHSKQNTTPTVQGKNTLTTRTDYVNRHNSVLQTTSYNFTATRTTSEICVGVVKAVPIHKKLYSAFFGSVDA